MKNKTDQFEISWKVIFPYPQIFEDLGKSATTAELSWKDFVEILNHIPNRFGCDKVVKMRQKKIS